mmetsp:Transcript_23229/g.55344  ORF Transcript_23229/g.55344 Transcript_23229/m.55344 type:complete len:231 (+) Transcript_23229:94-786(+)
MGPPALPRAALRRISHGHRCRIFSFRKRDQGRGGCRVGIRARSADGPGVRCIRSLNDPASLSDRPRSRRASCGRQGDGVGKERSCAESEFVRARMAPHQRVRAVSNNDGRRSGEEGVSKQRRRASQGGCQTRTRTPGKRRHAVVDTPRVPIQAGECHKSAAADWPPGVSGFVPGDASTPSRLADVVCSAGQLPEQPLAGHASLPSPPGHCSGAGTDGPGAVARTVPRTRS